MPSDERRQRRRTALVITAALIAILSMPWLLAGLRGLAWQIGVAGDVADSVRGRSAELDDDMSQLVPAPEGYTVLGVSDFMADGGSSAVVGLTAPGSMLEVTSDYGSAMRSLGWRQVSSDEKSLSMGFAMPDRGLDAYVLFREYDPGTVSVVVQLHRISEE